MRAKYQRAVKAYELQCEKALDRLIAKVEPDLKMACEKWGLDFCAGMGAWTFYFGGKSARQKYRKVEGEYHLLGDPRFLLDFFEPELAEMLDTTVDNRQSLGSLMNNIEASREDYEWVAIKANEWCLDEPIEVPPEIITVVNSIEAEYAYFGWVPRVLAEAVVAEYNRDWDSGSQLLASLPYFLDSDLKLIA